MTQLLDPPTVTVPAGGVINCNCRCHRPIESGGGLGNCVHCRIIGTEQAEPPKEDS